MDHFSDQNAKPVPPSNPPKLQKKSRTGFMLFAALTVVVIGAVFYLLLARLDRLNREVTQLNTQVQQSNTKAEAASQKASSALGRASQAEQNAQQAASQRDEAE